MKHQLVAVALALFTWTAHAELFSFYAITSNDSSGHAQLVGESQLFMDATLLGLGQVRLIFSNTGPEDAVVTRVYFDYAPELDLNLVAINDGNGVEFTTAKIKPINLPAGQSMEDAFISNLGVASLNPGPKKGINPGESLELILGYAAGYDFISALGSEELRVGLHVQSLPGGYSESFVNVVPEPATLPLLLLGSSALRWFRIKKSRRGKKGDSFTPYLSTDKSDPLQWVEIKAEKDRRHMPRNRLEAAINKVIT